jgi:hypothetical protein
MQSFNSIVVAMICSLVVQLLLVTDTVNVDAFVVQPSQSVQKIISHHNNKNHYNVYRSSMTSSSSSSLSSSLFASSSTTTLSKLPNPLKQLPWNVQKDREREVRRNKIERSKIYRQIGIAEDATYEEIVEATDRLIYNAGSNIKQKIQIEIMKDQILQHRLNERLKGLLIQERMSNTNKEARAMSNYEMEGYVRRCLLIRKIPLV